MIPSNSTRRIPIGFTLIEVLVVVGIIALLIAIGVTAMYSSMKSQQAVITKTTVVALENSVSEFAQERNGLPPLLNVNTTAANLLAANANSYVNSLAATDLGKKTLATLKAAGAVSYTGVPVVGSITGPLDAWQQPILMGGDATATSPGTIRWFWSMGPPPNATTAAINDSLFGNPVKGDDIGGNNNLRK